MEASHDPSEAELGMGQPVPTPLDHGESDASPATPPGPSDVSPTSPPSPSDAGPTSPTGQPGDATGPRSCLGSWRRWIRPVFFLVYGLVVVAATPPIILDIIHGTRTQSLETILAGAAFFPMVISIGIAAWGILNHIVCYTRPALQDNIIRILNVIPLYVLNCWFALRFPDSAIYLDTLRQLYQAFVIYRFVSYLLAFFEEVPNFDNRLVMKPQIKCPTPFCRRKVVPSKRLINRCRTVVHSYVIIRIIFTVISLITDRTSTFNEGNYSIDSAYLWVTVIVSSAQIATTYSLILLRKITKEELQLLPKSAAQFIGIKLVVLVYNFQSMFLNILAKVGAIKPTGYWGFNGDAQAFAKMLQNFLICIEMVFGAIFLCYAFDYRRYNTDEPRKSFLQFFMLVKWINRFRGKSSSSELGNSVQTDPPMVSSPVPLQAASQPKEAADAPRRRKAGHQFISLPDILLNHQDDPDHLAEIHSPRNQDGDDQTQDVGDLKPDGGHKAGGVDNPGFQGQSGPEDLNADDDEFRDDDSGDTDDFLDDQFLTDDDDDSDNDLPVDGRLDVPRSASSAPQKRRVKKVSYAGMTFDDMDLDKLNSPAHRSPTLSTKREFPSHKPTRAAEVPTRLNPPGSGKKRVKKVSYAGMTFDDMDYDHIKSHRSPTMDSEMAHAVTSIVEQNEERYTEVAKNGEGFGSSEA